MNYLSSTIQLFEYYKSLGEKAMRQLDAAQLFVTGDSESNSLAIMVKHLWGNMRSRWTDFRTSDGEKSWRNRDTEFEADIKDAQELWAKWEEGWQILFAALHLLKEEELGELVYIRNQGHTIVEAINRQLGHYAYHIGQIVFLSKMLAGKDWKSLSIPKGASKSYNENKFKKDKQKQHFTDEFLSKDKS
ncbi:MAG: DUF1572 domain-containing protein [Saprospiraceae bacterium]|nr:DUF1572 domain-containing protein [Saprospiraceae bacterium]